MKRRLLSAFVALLITGCTSIEPVAQFAQFDASDDATQCQRNNSEARAALGDTKYGHVIMMRHGKSPGSKKYPFSNPTGDIEKCKEKYRHLDDENGEKQVEALGKWIKKAVDLNKSKIVSLYSSTACRTRETAAALGTGFPAIQVKSDLYGDPAVDGLTFINTLRPQENEVAIVVTHSYVINKFLNTKKEYRHRIGKVDDSEAVVLRRTGGRLECQASMLAPEK